MRFANNASRERQTKPPRVANKGNDPQMIPNGVTGKQGGHGGRGEQTSHFRKRRPLIEKAP